MVEYVPMETVAGDGWASASFWQFVITTVASFAVGGLGAWATLRSSNPKRKVNWWIQSNTPLISSPLFSADDETALSVRFRGTKLRRPRIIELVVANEGRRDITAAMFHGNEPITFDLGAMVCLILEVTTRPSGSVRPSFETPLWTSIGDRTSGENWLNIPPCLLSRGQVVTVTVLVDGDEKPVECLTAPLVEVPVVSEPRRR
ncbi:hypothetical protein [Streptomyces sp. NPDC059080]|uniref:hypothetical protein n=1 Tax=Streptomyces sp. NPDC059080 TaxID=3346718 RepID=UPI0036AA30E3